MSCLVTFRPDPPHRPARTNCHDPRDTRRTLMEEYLTGMAVGIPCDGPGCATTPDTGFEALRDWVEGRA